MIITNNIDFFNYLQNKGVPITYFQSPPKRVNFVDDLIIVFPITHIANVSCNAHSNKYEDEYKRECDNIIDWFESCNNAIVITSVIKFDSEYMKEHAPKQYDRLQDVNYHKQIIHEKDLGVLTNPTRLQLRYKGIKPIKFDIVHTTGIRRPMFKWTDKKTGMRKQEDVHYLNVINKTKDKEERRKLRYLPHYTLFSQLYKKLRERGEL